MLEALGNAVRDLEAGLIEQHGKLPDNWPDTPEEAALMLLEADGATPELLQQLRKQHPVEG